jgi:hypothetical protein
VRACRLAATALVLVLTAGAPAPAGARVFGPARDSATVAAPVPVRTAPAGDSASMRTPADMTVVGGAGRAPVVARRDSVARQPWHEQPRFVMARSLLFPGWGQLHNRAWFKAALVAAAEGFLGARIVQDQRALDGLLSDLDRARADGDAVREAGLVNEYNSRLDQRLGREWLLGGVLAYAMVDAYVDANFRGFEVEFRTDPALPAGASPAVPTSGGGGPELRLALRRDF